MSKTIYYKVAGHLFCVTGEAEVLALMTNYEPFIFSPNFGEVRRGLNNCIFSLTITNDDTPDYTEELRQEDEGQTIICGRTADGKAVFEFCWWNETAGWLVCSEDYHEGRFLMTGKHEKMAIDNALMVMFALATADQGTVLFHAAVVSHEGKGYMFLGSSGTGKSTHARLWLKHIEGTELVNDDNPVVRDGVVYGSPWSGKTPCYRNISYPLGAIVMLSQAPFNKIQRLDSIEAYIALMSSISGNRWDSMIADGLHATENTLASTIPVWHLECLPDEAAAKLCHHEIQPAPLAEDGSIKTPLPLDEQRMHDEYIIKETIRLVEDGVSVTLPVSGNSMLPFIIGSKESVILQRPVQPKVGDVVLAWVSPGRYVVHRIIKIEGEHVSLMGDGNLVGTEHCTLSDVKALATHVVGSDEQPHDLYTTWRRMAAKGWWWLRPIRRYLLAIYRRVKR